MTIGDPDFQHGREPLSLSEVTGQDVLGSDGRVIGRLADLSVDLDHHAGPHLVQRVLVCRRRVPDVLLPWTVVERFEHSGVVLHGDVDPAAFEVTSMPDALGGDEILLVRDVLDTQIVDVVGQRLARVADVELSMTADGRLELVGVEVGFGAVLQRLGLARLTAAARRDVVAWADLHLTSERGHTVQLATPKSAVHHLDADGLAVLVDRLDTESAAEVLAATGPHLAARAIGAADPVVGERLLRAMPGGDAAQIVAAMPPGHASRWRSRLARTPTLLGRRFIRSRVWPRRRHPRPRGRG